MTTPSQAKPPMPPAPWAWCRSFPSIETYRAAMRVVEAPLLSTSATGPCTFLLALTDVGRLRIAGCRVGGAMFTAGISAADELCATVVLEATGGSLNSVPLEAGTLFLFPPGTVYRGWCAAGYRWLTVSVTRDEAATLAREHRWRIPGLPDAPMLSSRCSPDEMRSIRAMVRELDLWRPRPRPEPLDPAPLVGHAAVWGRILARAWTRGGAPRASSARRASGDALVRRVSRFIESRFSESLSAAEVCAAAGAPQRTVEHCFRERLGISPMRYLAVVRLRAARRALRGGAGPGDVTVAGIARSVGFRHMGRFAGAYRRMFGELPTETRPVGSAGGAGRAPGGVDVLEEMVGGG